VIPTSILVANELEAADLRFAYLPYRWPRDRIRIGRVWVCEWHDDCPWSGQNACGCGGAGMPCPSCNVSNPDNPPRLPAGFQQDESLDDE
jgi:hypothetical protein